ncbi:hypothetical protein W911_03710 [Hyphomicrobium nitrativorans NL23]|uniref:Uncharacterized protein n=1 Tax=Hyphomicrobium nitrativorans NL23 TaxID=1029756 RepID=V5SIZ3_9HYPH|nr:hypothetical protein W911_03710 [Hyphomicrobium nitrativorans NL23]
MDRVDYNMHMQVLLIRMGGKQGLVPSKTESVQGGERSFAHVLRCGALPLCPGQSEMQNGADILPPTRGLARMLL